MFYGLKLYLILLLQLATPRGMRLSRLAQKYEITHLLGIGHTYLYHVAMMMRVFPLQVKTSNGELIHTMSN